MVIDGGTRVQECKYLASNAVEIAQGGGGGVTAEKEECQLWAT